MGGGQVTRDEAFALLCEHTRSDSLRKHGLAVEAAMRHFSRRFEADEETWAIAGLLHDFDYEVHAIQSHADHTGVPRITPLEKTLYAVDEVCGFVTAVALVRPTKRVSDVDAASVRRKMKDKAFARAVSREMMLAGAEGLAVPFDEVVTEVVRAMSGIADRLDLAGAP